MNDERRQQVEDLDPDWRDHFMDIDQAYDFYRTYYVKPRVSIHTDTYGLGDRARKDK